MGDDARTTFADTAGRKWVVSVTVADLKRVRQETDVELGKLPVDKLAELMADPERFVDVLWVLVQDQAAKVGVTPEQFGRSLGGDALEAADRAFWRAWADFCPRQTRRLMLGLAEKAEAERERAVDRALEELAKPTSNGSATNSPGVPASTPTAGPSGS